MKFGSVSNPELVDFSLPDDHLGTRQVLGNQTLGLSQVCIGCAKWNKKDLMGFYPKGIKDELEYYASQFNSIELNATFYNRYSEQQIHNWRERTPPSFKFFPKVHRYISHIKRLNDVESSINEFCTEMRVFGDQLGCVFLQLHDNFAPKNFGRLQHTISLWPKDIPLAVELRHTDWFNEKVVAEEIYGLFEEHRVANIITDSAGRRDLLHMRMTNKTAFIRYVGSNHESDYPRLEDWIDRIKLWKSFGLENLYFFIHQNLEKESPLLSEKFIDSLNFNIGLNIKIPKGKK